MSLTPRMAARFLMIAGAALALAGCNSNKPAQPAANAQPGQVIAKVGSEDVTIHELNNELRLAGITPDKVNDDINRAALNEITKRKSLAQRAQQAGLDREPTVLLDLLRSREEVLARALLQRDIQTRVSGIGKADIERYINANPERFSKRQRFDVEQISISLAVVNQAFLDAVKDANALEDIEAKAVEMKMPYQRGAGVLFSGDLPPDLLQRLRARKATDIFLVRNAGVGAFFKVRSETPDPLAGDAAQQRAQVLMRGDAAREEIGKESSAAITYLGTYEKLMQKPAAPAPGATPAAPGAGGQAPPAKPPGQ